MIKVLQPKSNSDEINRDIEYHIKLGYHVKSYQVVGLTHTLYHCVMMEKLDDDEI